MAKVGFEYIAAAELDMTVSKSAATAKYTNGREIGPGANINGTANSSDVKDYGDDRTLLTDVSVTGGTINMELNEPTLENEAWMLGHTYEEGEGVIRNVNDIPPYLGIGFVGKAMSSKIELGGVERHFLFTLNAIDAVQNHYDLTVMEALGKLFIEKEQTEA